MKAFLFVIGFFLNIQAFAHPYNINCKFPEKATSKVASISGIVDVTENGVKGSVNVEISELNKSSLAIPNVAVEGSVLGGGGTYGILLHPVDKMKLNTISIDVTGDAFSFVEFDQVLYETSCF